MAVEKIEAIKKIGEIAKNQPSHEIITQERMPPNQEHFQSLMNQNQQNLLDKATLVNGAWVTPEGTEIAFMPNQELFDDQKMSVTSTNPDDSSGNQKRNKQQQVEEVDAIEGVSNTSASSKTDSLLDQVGQLNKKVESISQISAADLKTQANDLIAQIDNVKDQLSQSKVDIKPSYKNILHNRLTHIDDNLKIALSKAGIEYTAPQPISNTGSSNPLKRFIGMLTNSQHQLTHLSETIDSLQLNKIELSPARMLALQIKISYVQQQMELFTSMLNKALESTKTIMNVQV